MRNSRILGAAALLVTACPSVAPAFDTAELGQGGSLVLEDIAPLIAQSPVLKREIDAALAQTGKTRAGIVCGGMRFSGQWRHLSGYRVSPYVCAFADNRFLEIRASVRIVGAGGNRYERMSPEAMAKARRIEERNPVWQWLTKDPRGPN